MTKYLLSGLLAMAAATAPIGAGTRLDIAVSPSVAIEPATVTIRATVDAARNHRALEVIAESTDYYRSSVVQLDGDRAPRTTLVSFRSMPSGSYVVRVSVLGSRGETLMRSERPAHVVNRGGF